MHWNSLTVSCLLQKSLWVQVESWHLRDTRILEKWELWPFSGDVEALLVTEWPMLWVQLHPPTWGLLKLLGVPSAATASVSLQRSIWEITFLLLFSSFSDLQYERHSIDLCDLRVILQNFKGKSSAICSALPHECTGLFFTGYSEVPCPTWFK